MANTTNIENAGINLLEHFLFDVSTIQTDIKANDKTPSWDGEIYVYEDDSGRKGKLIGRVPVQVKTRKAYSDIGVEKKDFESEDLKNYNSEGGVLLILITYKDKENFGVYYRTLFKTGIGPLLVKNQRSHTIELKRASDHRDFRNALLYFLVNRDPLRTIHDYFKDAEFVEGDKVRLVAVEDKPLHEAVFSEFSIAYIETSGGIPKATRKIEEYQQKIEFPVKVKGEIFFEDCVHTVQKCKSITKFNPVLSIVDQDDVSQVNLSIQEVSKLQDIIDAYEFLNAAIEQGRYFIGDIEFTLKGAKQEELRTLESSEKLFRFAHDILLEFNLGSKECSAGEIYKDAEQIYSLHAMLIGRRRLRADFENRSLIQPVEALSHVFLLLLEKVDDNTCIAHRFVNSGNQDCSITLDDDKTLVCSKYLLLMFFFRLDTYKILDFLSEDEAGEFVLKEFDSFYSQDVEPFYIDFVLQSLMAYDYRPHRHKLVFAFELLAYLERKTRKEKVSDILKINKAQVEVRDHSVGNGFCKQLPSLLGKYPDDDMFGVCIHTLLENKEEAVAIVGALPDEEKEQLETLPIWNLYCRL